MNTETMKTALGFDFGTKSIGVAVGQQITNSARGLGIVANQDWRTIKEYIEKWAPDILIVGLPIDMLEKETAITRAAKTFANELQTRFALPVELVDEKLTSREARMILEEQDGRYQKSDIDMMSAQLILQSWLNEQSC